MAFVMLTEPLTAPQHKVWRLVYGALVGVLASPNIAIAGYYFTPEVALLVGNLLTFLVSPKGESRSPSKESKTSSLPDQVVAMMDGSIVFVHGFDGVITHWSAGCEELYGWTRSEAVGQAMHNLFGATSPENSETIHAQLRRNGRWTGERNACTSTGIICTSLAV